MFIEEDWQNSPVLVKDEVDQQKSCWQTVNAANLRMNCVMYVSKLGY